MTNTADGPRFVNPRRAPHYPQAEAHTWGAFAGLAIEYDGYCNVEVINPWSGNVFFVPDVFPRESDADLLSTPAILRKIADAMEAANYDVLDVPTE